jgi:glycerophosphoryl diester phosphodiesterase
MVNRWGRENQPAKKACQLAAYGLNKAKLGNASAVTPGRASRFESLSIEARTKNEGAMKLIERLEKHFIQLSDRVISRMLQPYPSAGLLQHCKIISHRGEHDNQRVLENTIEAFERVRAAGVWGLELDLRWTRDLKPVVFHDADLNRLYKGDIKVSQVTRPELQSAFPLIPSLEEVVARYGRRLHLMIEIKKETYPDPDAQCAVVRQILAPLSAIRHYHLMSLHPEMFDFFSFLPPATFLPIARLNVRWISQMALRKKYGGITGHYALLPTATLRKHQCLRQQIGTGFVNSRNCLFRELRRGVVWIFSNNAVSLQAEARQLATRAP